MGGLLRQAYVRREIGFDDAGLIAWSGTAIATCGASGRGTLLIDSLQIDFAKTLKRTRWSWNEIESISAEGEELRLATSEGIVRFQVQPAKLAVSLKSGKHSVDLDVNDLVARLTGR